MGSLAWEAILRFQSPEPYQAGTVMIVAGAGVIVNGITAWLFMSGSKNDLNIRGAFLHMLSDAFVSVGVIVSAGLYLWLGWDWIDPLVSLLIALVILWATWSMFKQSLHLMFDGVPVHIDLRKLTDTLKHMPGVLRVHDVHVWAMATSKVALTAHIVLREGVKGDDILKQAVVEIQKKFGIEHVTLQLESASYSESCHGCE
jgi:cobalt-zinc-cadmium efflux system protein